MIKVFLDGVEISNRVEIDLSFVEKLDMELDEGFIVLAHSERKQPFEMFSTIEIFENEQIIFSGKISQDNVSLSSYADELFNHNITIIEHTKILEKFLVTGKTFTQPTDETTVPFYTLYDVVESLRKTSRFSLFGNEEINAPFKIPQELEDELNLIVSPEFSFKDITLREALNEVFFYIDSIVRIDRNDNISLERFNDLKGEIEFFTENFKRDQNILDYSTTMSTDILNSVNTDYGFSKYNYEYYPGKDLWTNPRSLSLSQFNFEEGFVPTPKPIYKIEDLFIGAELKIIKKNKETLAEETIIDTDLYPLNITRNVVEKQEYSTLPTRLLNDVFALTKESTIYYTYGSKNLNIGQSFGVFDTQTIFSNLLQAVLPFTLRKDFDIPEDADWFGFSRLFDDGNFQWLVTVSLLGNFQTGDFLKRHEGLFRVKYIPILPSIRYEVVRDDVSEVFIDTKTIANQKLRIVDLERFTNNMKGRINQLGNSGLILSHKVGSISETFNIGDFTTEKFVITKKEVIVQRDHYIVNYELNKNFNKMSQFMGVDQEIRQFEIGEAGRTLDRDLNYNEFVEIYADDNGQSNTGSSTLIQSSILLNTVNPDYSALNFAKYSVFTSPQLLDDDNNQVALNLPVYRVSGGNAFGFYMDFETNASAGDQLLIGDNKWYNFESFRRYNTPFKYTDEIGRLESFLLSIHDGALFAENDFESENFAAEQLPVFTKTFSNQFMSGSFYVDKDNRERLKMTFLYHLLSKNLGEVVIGELFSTNNSFFIEETNIVQLRAWNDRMFLIRDKNRLLNNEDLKITNPNITFNYDENYFEINDNISSYGSWALTNDEGHPYIMVNSNKKRIVFEFKGFRSGVDFGGQVPEGNLKRPTLVTSSSTSDSVMFVLGNPNEEPTNIELTLGQETQTKEVASNSQSTNFTFTNLEPNTNFTLTGKCTPIFSSLLLESQQQTFSQQTQIIPIDPPTVVESRVESYELFDDTYYIAFYNVTNNDDTFALDVYNEIDGFLNKTNTGVALNPGQTVELGVALLGSDQSLPENRIEADVNYQIRFRTRTTTFNNNWDSPFTSLQGLFIGVLTPPNFGTAQTTDTTASVSWGNPNDVATDIEVQLLSAPFPQGTLEQTITQSIPAQGGTTINFTGLDDDKFYSTRAKLIGTGFNVDSPTADSTSFKTDVSRTSTPSIQNVQRTTSSISFDLKNNDSQTADIYWNTTGSPDENDNVLSNISSNSVGSAQITGLSEAQVVTIYYRAESAVRPISLQGQSTTSTFRQLVAPVFQTASSTSTTIAASFRNDNNVAVTMEGIAVIMGNVVGTNQVFVDANSSNSLSFSNLDPNTSHVITAKFLQSGINLESASTTSPTINTQKDVMESPSITIISASTETVTFDLINNEPNTTATIQYGVDGDFSNSVQVSTSGTFGLSGLTPDTSYTLNAKSSNANFLTSDTTEKVFNTDPLAGTQWVLIKTETVETSGDRDLTLRMGEPNCVEDEQLAKDFIDNELQPSDYPQGFVVKVEAFAVASGIGGCTSYFYEAQ